MMKNDDDKRDDIHPSWDAEIDRRLESVLSGEAKTITGDEFRARRFEKAKARALETQKETLAALADQPLSDHQREALDRGLEDARQGRIGPMGSFDKYVTEDEDEPVPVVPEFLAVMEDLSDNEIRTVMQKGQSVLQSRGGWLVQLTITRLDD